MSDEPVILVAGGGTGGHVYPGLAIAHALKKLADVRVVFVGSNRGLESRVVPAQGFSLELLEVEPMKGGGASRAIRGALVAAKAMRSATSLIGRLRPSAVLSVGGYAAGPAALAAVGRGVPIAVLEPNRTLGLTNRLLAPFARRAYVAWPETGRHFRDGRARLYGVPLRSAFSPRPYVPRPSSRRLLVLGGSLGARALNERLPPAIAEVVATTGPIDVVHQCGADHEAAAREAYARAGLASAVVTPFLDDVATKIAEADVVIARAGASAVAEITAVGRAAVFVPFPHAADDHQAQNALALEAEHGCVCLRQEVADEARLAREILALFSDETRRVRMADAARAHGRPEATDDIARDLLTLAGISRKRRPDTKSNGASGHARGAFRIDKEIS